MVIDFFDIPVYRVKESQYNQELNKHLEKHMRSLEMKNFVESRTEWATAYQAKLMKSYGGQWEFNEIIGYIKLYILWTQIRGEYYQTDAKRIVKTRKKVIKFKSLKVVDEKELPTQGNNKEIYTIILDYLTDCQTYLKKQYIDLRVFKTIGPFIDWKSLLVPHQHSILG